MSEPQGLSSAQATRLLETVGPNAVPLKHTGLAERILRKLWAPVPWMLEATTILEFALAKWLDATIILAVLASTRGRRQSIGGGPGVRTTANAVNQSNTSDAL